MQRRLVLLQRSVPHSALVSCNHLLQVWAQVYFPSVMRTENEILYWFVRVETPGSWEPGPWEKDGKREAPGCDRLALCSCCLAGLTCFAVK